MVLETTNKNYKTLRNALDQAYNRASKGKGAERHADGKPFEDQPILTIQRGLGSTHFALGQIMKKATELIKFDGDAAKKELLDIMVYAAAAWIYLDENEPEYPSGQVSVRDIEYGVQEHHVTPTTTEPPHLTPLEEAIAVKVAEHKAAKHLSLTLAGQQNRLVSTDLKGKPSTTHRYGELT